MEEWNLEEMMEGEEGVESYCEVQQECILANNEILRKQYEQIQEYNQCIQEQEFAYQHNDRLASSLKNQITSLYEQVDRLQQQLYYQREELDRLVEQKLKNQQTIQEQETAIYQNNRVLAYDEKLLESFGKVFQQMQPNTVNAMAKVALMNP